MHGVIFNIQIKKLCPGKKKKTCEYLILPLPPDLVKVLFL